MESNALFPDADMSGDPSHSEGYIVKWKVREQSSKVLTDDGLSGGGVRIVADRYRFETVQSGPLKVPGIAD